MPEKENPMGEDAARAVRRQPPITSGGSRDSEIPLRLSPGEKELIDAAALRVGFNRSELLRTGGQIEAEKVFAAYGGREEVATWYQEQQGRREALAARYPEAVRSTEGATERNRTERERRIREFIESQEIPPTRKEIARATETSYPHLTTIIAGWDDIEEVDRATGKPGRRAKGLRFRESDDPQ